ncbi:predicted protein [Postia placenta Mad-698-R]|nr:predicted protein [Postia placenta Mad-698-R]
MRMSFCQNSDNGIRGLAMARSFWFGLHQLGQIVFRISYATVPHYGRGGVISVKTGAKQRGPRLLLEIHCVANAPVAGTRSCPSRELKRTRRRPYSVTLVPIGSMDSRSDNEVEGLVNVLADISIASMIKKLISIAVSSKRLLKQTSNLDLDPKDRVQTYGTTQRRLSEEAAGMGQKVCQSQSRFPTTAMREEVGRAIGLSARKVQIWFQNQRQKARRPRGQATTPLTRPPQFGPFQNAHLGSSSSDMAAFSGTSAQGHTSSGSHLVHLNPIVGYGHEGTYQESQMSRALPRSVTSPYLSGPGIPGSASSSSARTDYTLPRDARGAAVVRETPRPSTSYPTVNRASTYIRPRPATAEVSSSASFTAGEHTLRQPRLSVDSGDTQLDHPVTLPPLVIGPEPNRRQASTSPFSSMSEVWRRWHPSPAGGMSPRPLAIPPPFTLQPHPQWDDPAFSPFSRPSYQIGHPSISSAASGYGSTMPPISPPVTSPSAESHPSSLARHHRAESVSSGNSTRESPTQQAGWRSYDYDNFHE